jgi:hypothetical protein
MRVGWSREALDLIGGAGELQIATRRADETLRGWLPIWVVCVDGQVYVRTWHRRGDGWFGHAVALGRARIRVPGLEADVIVEDVGDRDAGLRSRVDAAYGAKYGSGTSVDQMITDDAVASTLRIGLA